MIAALICVVSMAALLQFCISYCRSVIAASRRVALSEQVREIAGIATPTVSADDFARLRQLVQLCPERGDDRTEISAVGKYYALLKVLHSVAQPMVPSVAEWAERERRSCSYFIAVVLDRRIAYSRDLLAQQLADAS
jgi:hypothetical protein